MKSSIPEWRLVVRRDWHFWRFHIIRRTATIEQQYGIILWGFSRSMRISKTVDVWFGRTLWTFRCRRYHD
jgi:hypothetical protein